MTTAAMATSSTTLSSLLDTPDVTQPQLAAHLDALDSETRRSEIHALSGKAQKRLWDVCKGAPAFTLEDLVPASLGEGKEVIYAGKNSLAMFTLFEKRMMRKGGEIIGYNFQTMAWFTGPGYFTCLQAKDGEILFDYTKVPAQGPTEWPTSVPNTGMFSKLVYGNMNDYNRRVSKDVLIGSAFRNGKDIHSYYVLSRR